MTYRAHIIMAFAALTSTVMHGQVHYGVDHLACAEGDGPVRSRVLHSDSLATSTLLCISDEVRPHVHAFHTEHVHVLAGEALMLLGDSMFKVGPGSFLTIPQGTTHAVRVRGNAPLRVISVQSPGYDGTDRVMVAPPALWTRP
ncbi:MAG: cupin domain-containing protein [Flavobacteriales bacterium]